MQSFSEFRFRTWGESLEERLSPGAMLSSPLIASDPTVPRPPTNPPSDPVPAPEPSPGPFPGSNPPIVYPPPPLGGPVGPA
ncbi:MAG: hypothetical protein P4L85_19745 [Paludisphaera borealis]|uniref:hypothetical protein n=1 Tax=Paludisphaera borealis TaxID=1387353 RepID=UPI00283DBEA2|nr:hypothetical protein [Paludisphaera borealis]MDR3621594.1 hypothetical protein [Paludisphaera borealis]